jgi:hypothetical protein
LFHYVLDIVKQTEREQQMPYHGSPRCIGCGGEDCVCCEVYLEEQADLRHPQEPEEWDEFDRNEFEEDEDTDEYCEECGEELDTDCQGRQRCPNCDGPCPDCSDGGMDESMDGDFDTGMASAGHGLDEDYGDWGHDAMYEE